MQVSWLLCSAVCSYTDPKRLCQSCLTCEYSIPMNLIEKWWKNVNAKYSWIFPKCLKIWIFTKVWMAGWKKTVRINQSGFGSVKTYLNQIWFRHSLHQHFWQEGAEKMCWFSLIFAVKEIWRVTLTKERALLSIPQITEFPFIWPRKDVKSFPCVLLWDDDWWWFECLEAPAGMKDCLC